MKVGGDKLTIEVHREATMRADEYVIVTFDKEGNEVQGLSFHVTDSGKIYYLRGPSDLIEAVLIA